MTVVAPRCWCGNTTLEPFSPEYVRCPVCDTLVTSVAFADDIAAVTDHDQGFYGREYWFSHQEQDLGFTNITDRARADLPERCLHWLSALLKYKLPPGRTLELGSAHGGFVALMQWAGFEASGLELSPWVVDFARRTFDVPMLLGTLERQQITAGSLDAIALMDVLEHLPDPVGTMRRALELLKPDGLLLIQTPCYVEGRTYADMVSASDPFLEQLKAIQHLYLYSPRAIRMLFRDLGAEHVVSESAIFTHYDQFVVVSRVARPVHEPEAIADALSASARGRMVLALLDERARARDASARTAELAAQLAASEADRAARLDVIERQGSELGRIPHLEALLAASEADRAARLDVIERQGSELGRIPHLEALLAASEADRAARLAIIERQDAQIGGLQDRLVSAGRLVGETGRVIGRLVLGRRWLTLQSLLSAPTAVRERDELRQQREDLVRQAYAHAQIAQVELRRRYHDLVRRGAPLPTFADVEFQCYSQNSEDGILLYIFSLISTTTRKVVEICAGNGVECNAANLIVNHGWQGLLFDGDEANVGCAKAFYSTARRTFVSPPTVVHAWITAENINDLVIAHGFSGAIDLLSIDVDGNDYWILKALSCVQPAVIVVEFSALCGPERAATMSYQPDYKLDRSKQPYRCGASLAAFVTLLKPRGYRLIGVQSLGFNAFFVREGLGNELLPEIAASECYLRTPRLHVWEPKYLDMIVNGTPERWEDV
jgi:2-polyprenyl-3-methyl-5-hydroxy-6-metoxy-1,4-benzoquinol methylase